MHQPKLQLDQVTLEQIQDLQREFFANGLVRLPKLLIPDDQDKVRNEAIALLERDGRRRDFDMAQTENTPRHMRNVGGVEIIRDCPLFCNLYDDPVLRNFISGIIGEPALTCPYEMERMIITSLQKQGDTHGWHWDDYSIALVWILQAPSIDCGGLVQCIPHTRWNRAEPNILKHMVTSPIHSHYFNSGEAYLMQTRETLHRVYPIVKEGHERIILNFAFATAFDIKHANHHETVDALWS